MIVVKDCEFVARVQVGIEVLKRFLRADGESLPEQLLVLRKNRGVIVSYRHGIRVRKISGTGWYELSGYRQDGVDLRAALGRLQAYNETWLREVDTSHKNKALLAIPKLAAVL